jgi:anti-anti-sigma regulatory factor
LNFAKCNRLDTSGIRALEELNAKMNELGKDIYIHNIHSTPYKALKLSGKFDSFKYPHKGDL